MARHINAHRWCLYAVATSLIIWVVAQYAGIGNLIILVALVAVNVALNLAAYDMEAENCSAVRSAHVSFTPFLVGIFMFLVIWTPIIVYHIVSAGIAPKPWWQHALVFGAALVHAGFGITVMLRYMRIDDMWKKDKNIEITYLVLEALFAAVVVIPVVIGGALTP